LVRKVFGPHAPEQADALTGLGEVLSAQGQHTEALASIQQAMELQLGGLGPKHVSLGETLMRMGKVQLALGRGAQATASFERALQLENIEQNAPLTAELRLALAQVLASRPEQQQRARELAQRALEFYARHSWGVREKAEAESLLTRLERPSSRD
jgi:tetratricopeptide (TPR) repeat protein